MLPVLDASLCLVEQGGKSRRRWLGDIQCKLAAIQVFVQSIQHRTNSREFAKCRAYETICRTYTREKSINWVALNTFSPQESVLRSPVAAGLFLTPQPFNVDLVMSANKQAKLYRHHYWLAFNRNLQHFFVCVVNRFVTSTFVVLGYKWHETGALFMRRTSFPSHAHKTCIDLKLMISKLPTISTHYITYTIYRQNPGYHFTINRYLISRKVIENKFGRKTATKKSRVPLESTWFAEFIHFLLIYGPYLISHTWQHPQWNKTSARDSTVGSAPASTCKTYGSHWWRRPVARIASHSQISLSAGLHTFFFILLRTIRVSLSNFFVFFLFACFRRTHKHSRTQLAKIHKAAKQIFCLFCSRRWRNLAVFYVDCLETYRTPLDINGFCFDELMTSVITRRASE